MHNDSYKREYIRALESERNVVRFYFNFQILVLIVMFILMHDTKWYDAGNYRMIGVFCFVGAVALIVFHKLYFQWMKWPEWFHAMEAEIAQREKQKKQNVKFKMLKGVHYVVASFAIVCVITVVPTLYLPWKYQFLPIIIAMYLFVIAALIAYQISMSRGNLISIFHGFLPDIVLIVIFGVVCPFVIYPFLKPNAFQYTSHLTFARTDIDKSTPIKQILRDFNIKDCAFANPCSKIKAEHETRGQLDVKIETTYRGAHVADAFRKHKVIVVDAEDKFIENGEYKILAVQFPSQDDVLIQKDGRAEPFVFSVYSLLALIFVFIFAISWKNISGNAYKKIADELEKQGVNV